MTLEENLKTKEEMIKEIAEWLDMEEKSRRLILDEVQRIKHDMEATLQ